MSIPSELRDFVREYGDEQVLSVYIGARPVDPAARGAWRADLRDALREVRAELPRSDERDAFDAAAHAIVREVRDLADQAHPGGQALFCTAGGPVLTCPLPEAERTEAF